MPVSTHVVARFNCLLCCFLVLTRPIIPGIVGIGIGIDGHIRRKSKVDRRLVDRDWYSIVEVGSRRLGEIGVGGVVQIIVLVLFFEMFSRYY